MPYFQATIHCKPPKLRRPRGLTVIPADGIVYHTVYADDEWEAMGYFKNFITNQQLDVILFTMKGV